jgi:Na+-driven multidrug efflux pump
MPFFFAQFAIIALYFFIRLDGLPNLAAASLAVGAVINVALDYLFVAVYDWGLTGAAFATGISQTIPLLVMLYYFFWPKRRLKFSFGQKNWKEIFQAAYNGVSELINEISGGIITFIFNWMMIQRGGIDGVAAITVVNYLLMLGFMVFFSISDTIQVMLSQNFGARQTKRIEDFLKTASWLILLVSGVFITALLTLSEPLILLFVDDQSGKKMLAMATELMAYVWPVFLFSGANMLISGYLTAIHLPFQSGIVALCRSLILPAGFLFLLYIVSSDYRFVAALSLAEGVTFVIAFIIFLRHTPYKEVLPN